MTKRTQYRVVLFVLASLVWPVVPTGSQVGAVGAVGAVVGAYAVENCYGDAPQGFIPYNTPYFGTVAFEKLWARADQLVACGQVDRNWYWGPAQVSGPIYEKLAGGMRLVQYFEKSRMEINNLNADRTNPASVSNGLLTRELVSNSIQTGENSFEPGPGPANIVIAGDENSTNPTYVSFASVTSTNLSDKSKVDKTGQDVTSTLNRAGVEGNDPTKAGTVFLGRTKYVYYEPLTKHNVAKVFWDFLHTKGPVMTDTVVSAQPEYITTNWYDASGLPLSDAYWVKATIAGQPQDVLVQAFERRVLTYVPLETKAQFRVAMGNIGIHYVKWRYPNGLPGQARVYKTEGTGGRICRVGDADQCIDTKVDRYPRVAY